MHIAVAQVLLQIHASSSLKDKRRVIYSLVSKLRNRHSVSVAEVDPNESWNVTTIGIAVVSGDRRTATQILERALTFVERAAPEAEVIGTETDVWSFDAL